MNPFEFCLTLIAVSMNESARSSGSSSYVNDNPPKQAIAGQPANSGMDEESFPIAPSLSESD